MNPLGGLLDRNLLPGHPSEALLTPVPGTVRRWALQKIVRRRAHALAPSRRRSCRRRASRRTATVDSHPLARVREHRSAEGWTVDRIVQEIAARCVDVAAIEPFNLIRWPGNISRTAWYDDVLERLKATAVRANCRIVGVAQLNMARAREENPPEPALRDIRDSGTAQYIATHILALHREHDRGQPTKKGMLRFLKVRNGVRGSIDVEFKAKRLAFEECRPAPKHE